MSKINFLPPWVETNLQPAFYDTESGTCLQQTSRMYAKVNQLVRSVNEQNETIADYVQQFIDLRDYVEDYFENLDVQQEINAKLNEMVIDGTMTDIISTYLTEPLEDMRDDIDEFETSVNQSITEMRTEVNAKVSGSPLVASSTAGMTETDRVYVNTTDGNWYYYDGDSWEIGGTYQSSGIAEGSITVSDVAFHKRSANLWNKDATGATLGLVKAYSDDWLQTNAAAYTAVVAVSPNTTYFVSRAKSGVGNRFCVWETENSPANLEPILAAHGTSDPTNVTGYTFTTTADTHYLAIFYTNTNAQPTLDPDAIASTIMVNTGTSYAPYAPYYVLDINSDDIKDGTIDYRDLAFSARTAQLWNSKDGIALNLLLDDEHTTLVSSASSYTVVIPCEASTTYRVERFFSGKRFKLWTTAEYPDVGVEYVDVVGTTGQDTSSYKLITTGATAQYLCAFVFNSGADSPLTWDEVKDLISISKGADSIGLMPYYLIPFTGAEVEDHTIPVSKLEYDPSNYITATMWNTIAGVGDSYTEGGMWMHGGWIPDAADKALSYIACIGKKNGVNYENFGVGGATTRSYQTATGGLPKVLSNPKADLYYLGLGINDAQTLGVQYLGSISDIHDDYTLNPDTFYGNYGRIIDQIKAYAPNAKFIMIACMRGADMGANYDTFSNAIKNIAQHYGFPFIDPKTDFAFQSYAMQTLSNNHPTPAGYTILANIIEKQTAYEVNKTPSYFEDANYGSLTS